jgi:hypothetical protein
MSLDNYGVFLASERDNIFDGMYGFSKKFLLDSNVISCHNKMTIWLRGQVVSTIDLTTLNKC